LIRALLELHKTKEGFSVDRRKGKVMPSEQDEENHAKLSLPIDPEATGRLWLEGGGNPLVVQTQVFNGCHRWLSLYSRGLAPETLENIIWLAMKEAFVAFKTQQISIHEALLTLQRALNRLRAQEDRRRKHEQPLSNEFIELYADPRSSYDEIHARDFWRQAVLLIERHMTEAFLSLSNRDQDIIVSSYGLQEVSDPHRSTSYPEFPSADAEKRALSRARQKFNGHLESLLVAELDHVLVFNRPLYEAALRIVRGGKVPLVFAMLGSRRRS